MFKISKKIAGLLFFGLILLASSCTFDQQLDPNRPSLSGVLIDASQNQLNNLVVGVESAMRNSLAIQTTGSGTMARELYLFDADPRNTGDLLGGNGATLDNNSFYSTAPWGGRYRTIKNANILLQSVDNTIAVTDAQKEGYRGFARTVIAYQLIEVLRSYNRARIDVADSDNLGPILEFDQALSEIRTLLDQAQTNLGAAGAEFAFALAGFEGFDTPAGFTQFNRAVAAEAALYAGDGAATLAALSSSYFDLNGDITIGPQHVYSLGAGDTTNGLFKVPSVDAENANNGDQIIVQDSWILDAEVGDTRVAAKAAIRPNPTTQDDLNGTHETRLYATNVSPIDLLRNEELILIYAEANILSSNLPEAVTALNVIRSSAGLSDYSGAETADALTTEMLNQRRYSLWAENHRMFDLRRYNLSNTLPTDRSGDQIFNVFPIPLSENEGQ